MFSDGSGMILLVFCRKTIYKELKTNVREVGKTNVVVISLIPSWDLQKGSASTIHSWRESKTSSSTHSSGAI